MLVKTLHRVAALEIRSFFYAGSVSGLMFLVGNAR